MNLQELRKKIIHGDLSVFHGPNKNKKLIHPVEAAKLISSLPGDILPKTYLSLAPEKQISVFPYLDPLVQKSLISNLQKSEASVILNGLSSDDRLNFFSGLKGIELSHYLEYLDSKTRKATHDMLGYPEGSVARIINTEFAEISGNMTIAEAQEHLRKFHKDTEAADVVYVVDKEGKLIDDIPIRRLILNDPQKKIDDILDGFYISLQINESKEDALMKFKEYDRMVLPVVNQDNVLLGVLTADDVLDVEEKGNTEEMQKFGGLESLDYPYVKTSFISLIRKRAGWLIILFISEMLTATAMGYFDDEISKAVVLALFVPLIISSGGNSGSQAATLIIRAMAVKELSFRDWWYVMKREILSGLTLGIILGTIGFVRIALWQKFHWFDYTVHWQLVAITIFFSLIGIVTWGTLSGSMIPILLKRLGLDPATSSAPFVATLVDVTGLVIYFSIAAIILKGTLL